MHGHFLKLGSWLGLGIGLAANVFNLANANPAATRPIVAVVPDLNHLQKWNAMTGDTADPFWAEDDNLYHFTCDGPGFGKASRNLCFNELSGSDEWHLTGRLVNAMDEYGKAGDTQPDGATWKVTGQECIDGVFYAFVVRNVYGDKSQDPLMRQTSFNASLIQSKDHGLNWTRPASENYQHPMWPGTRFGAPCFIHYGQNGGQVREDQARQYVYALSDNGFWNGGDDFILGRVRRSALPKLRAADWTYYVGGDGTSSRSWSGDLAKARPILERPGKLGWTAPVFVPAVDRYLLVSWYITPVLKHWFKPERVTYDFFEAPHPWGPWSPVGGFDDNFLATPFHMYGPNLCAKYQETQGDAVKIDLYTSGCPFSGGREKLYRNWRIPLQLITRPLPPVAWVDDDDPAIHYTGDWQHGTNRAYAAGAERHAYQGDLHYSHQSGDTAAFAFEGTGIEVRSEKSREPGRMEIWLDGKSQGQVNLLELDFPRLSQIAVFSAQNLAPGKHAFKLVNTGTNDVTLDALVVTKGPEEETSKSRNQ